MLYRQSGFLLYEIILGFLIISLILRVDLCVQQYAVAKMTQHTRALRAKGYVSNQAGFSLIELLVALALSCIFILLLFPVLGQRLTNYQVYSNHFFTEFANLEQAYYASRQPMPLP